MNTEVDAYVARSDHWPNEMGALRAVLVEAGLDEEIKWGKPCYSHDGKNLAIMQETKSFLALMFFKGALLDDPAGILESQGPNSRSAKRVCFRSVEDVARLCGAVERLISSAIEVEESGIEVGPAPEPTYVDELQRRLDDDPQFRAGFESLTPGRRREYHLHFSAAKQASTRLRRIDKYSPQILAGKGLRDR